LVAHPFTIAQAINRILIDNRALIKHPMGLQRALFAALDVQAETDRQPDRGGDSELPAEF
jgi:hypothetical protein